MKTGKAAQGNTIHTMAAATVTVRVKDRVSGVQGHATNPALQLLPRDPDPDPDPHLFRPQTASDWPDNWTL